MSEPLEGAARRLYVEALPDIGDGRRGMYIERMIRDVIAEAKAEEREACAQLAESHSAWGEEIAVAMRKRTP